MYMIGGEYELKINSNLVATKVDSEILRMCFQCTYIASGKRLVLLRLDAQGGSQSLCCDRHRA